MSSARKFVYSIFLNYTSNEIPEMIAAVDSLHAGFPLNDPSDPRHEYITSLRRKFAEFLHRASASLTQQGEENTLDAVHALVCNTFLVLFLSPNGAF